jgi:hypothetical protein
VPQGKCYRAECGVLVSERAAGDIRDVGNLRNRGLFNSVTDWRKRRLAGTRHRAHDNDAVWRREQARGSNGLPNQGGGIRNNAMCAGIALGKQTEKRPDADALMPLLQRRQNCRNRSDGIETTAFSATTNRPARINGRVADFTRPAVSARDKLMVRDQPGADTAVELYRDGCGMTSGRTPNVLPEGGEIRVILD